MHHFYFKKDFKLYPGTDTMEQISKNITQDVPAEVKACIEEGFALDTIISGGKIVIITRNPVSFLKDGKGQILSAYELEK